MTGPDPSARPPNFIRDIIDEDLRTGKHTRVVTRFPPEPNGYLHIGHAKAICLNFGLAADYGGVCHLRFDDTNPTTEDLEYVESMQRDIRWLGFDWGDKLFYASDYFDRFYLYATRLIEKGLAYVDSASEDQIRELRGTLTTPGRPSEFRERSVSENLDLFRRMRAGEFEEGAHVLRGKCDLAAANLKMRDPLLYRIRHPENYPTGKSWCIYPMYDYAHPLSDAIEGITHSLCTLEFENNRELYDWVIESCETEARPRQYEFARLNLGYTVMSKRKLLKMVEGKQVEGWDDPRMPTLAGLRRRGVTPDAIRAFCDRIGVAKANSTVDLGKLEFAVRDDLNRRAPRVMCVLRPLRVVLEGMAEGQVEEIEAPSFPPDVGKPGTRRVPLTRVVFIDRDDFHLDPPPGFHRLAPGREVRLRFAGYARCTDVTRDRNGEVVELRCNYRSAAPGEPVPHGTGIIHWVSADQSLACDVNLYDRLFTVEKPDEAADFMTCFNHGSHEQLTGCRIEPSVVDAAPGARFQFERVGYFVLDSRDGPGGAPIFNRVVPLRDSFPRQAEAPAPAGLEAKKKNVKAQTRPDRRSRADQRERARATSPELAAKLARFTGELKLGAEEADLLTGDLDLAAFYEAAVAASNAPAPTARWVINELLGQLRERPIDSLAFGGNTFGRLVGLVEAGTISAAGGKEVLAELIESGGDPAEIVLRKNLRQVSDAAALGPLVDKVLADNPDAVARYKAGKTGLLGFLVGQVMKASGGAASPEKVQALLRARLS
ncbi:MAG TPA: glutamine--tRNA ligase/YqeY domain fusion protein [Kofleriaceae bacterium]|nr:glutamine--tRNA ligase/YqeY domain fusion protein [Kofleriaceae bacterium]